MNKESQETADPFALIGQRVPEWGEGLCSHPPEVLPDVLLPTAPYQKTQDFAPSDKPSTPEDLRKGVHALQKKMLPFLQNFAPSVTSKREKFLVTKADWRLVDRTELGRWDEILSSGDAWETVKLPHYGGPVGPATALYRSTVELPENFAQSGRVFLCFRGADYKAQVFLNGVFVMEHEGFFAPFEADVSALVRPGKNRLVVRLDNEHPSYALNAEGERVYGEKIYAATGLGWDDPKLGWHHCPPGMGLYQDVFFERRAGLHVQDLWVRPLPKMECAEVHVTVRNTDSKTHKAALRGKVYGRNFEADLPEVVREVAVEPGLNTWKLPVRLEEFRWWSPDEPWLYQAQIVLRNENDVVIDSRSSDFGMRTFRISEDEPVKGRIFLNGEQIRLRGANTMGHEQQCVFHKDWKQLHEDILIAKYAGLNFLRITQRPVQKEVYEVCDRLGMMVQTDLPLFGKIPRPQFAEGVRQAGEMERLIREHASCVLVSFINEPSPSWTDTANRHLVREEFFAFLRACTEIVGYENPDRQIKEIDGDYEPPSPGLPDQHCYCGWYAGHCIDLGMLHRGHWMQTKPGWFYGCGEFGTEGLESADLMRRRYPADWLPDADENWLPSQIAYAQTGSIFGLWIDAGKSLEEWVANSQEHQAWSVRMMTRAFRRDRRMVTFAIHLLIDAFPSGWMKTLVDCERNPKPAYFEFRDALAPLLVDIRCDRWAWWAGESLSAEIWICHDKMQSVENQTLRYVFELDGKPIISGNAPAEIPQCDSRFQGNFETLLPDIKKRTSATLRVALCAPDGRIVNETQETYSVFPKRQPITRRVALLDTEDKLASQFIVELNLSSSSVEESEVIVSSRAEDFARVRHLIEAGATLLLLQLPIGEFDFDGHTVKVEKSGSGHRQFVSRATGYPAVQAFEKNDFRFWFDPAADSVTALLDTVLIASGWTSILEATQPKGKRSSEAPACAEYKIGHGRVIICQMKITGRMAANPPAALFIQELLAQSSETKV
ncbi:MAG: glycoside hydrolase family 2 protein [Chthoniobacterales bacterium]